MNRIIDYILIFASLILLLSIMCLRVIQGIACSHSLLNDRYITMYLSINLSMAIWLVSILAIINKGAMKITFKYV